MLQSAFIHLSNCSSCPILHRKHECQPVEQRILSITHDLCNFCINSGGLNTVNSHTMRGLQMPTKDNCNCCATSGTSQLLPNKATCIEPPTGKTRFPFIKKPDELGNNNQGGGGVVRLPRVQRRVRQPSSCTNRKQTYAFHSCSS